MIEAKVVCDSVPKKGGRRLTTVVATYPRCIHPEYMTHRVFSRNASSSRAIPVKKMLEKVEQEPFIPVWWGKNQAGMQAREEVDPETKEKALEVWMSARNSALFHAGQLMNLGVHKQIVNRLLEPFGWITIVWTSTEWQNFFNLRVHPDAEDHMQLMAKAVQKVYEESKPQELSDEEWHLPFIRPEEKQAAQSAESQMVLVKCSVARCARVSYLNHDGSEPDMPKDLELHARLLESGHMSPFEHQARPHPYSTDFRSGNLVGWVQYRKTLPNEAVYSRSW